MNDRMNGIRMDASEVNRLIDLTLQYKRQSEPRFGEYALFQEALGDTQETDATFSRFLKDVSTCPEEVIRAAQRLLAERRFT